MDPIFKKLNFKGQSPLYIINAPHSFKTHTKAISSEAEIRTAIPAKDEAAFVLAFVTKQSEVDRLAKKIGPFIKGDGLFWFAYPKGTSKKFKCEFNRDTGWNEMGKQDFEPVRMIAIDEDWSALRFRKAAYISTMTRSSALSKTGKEKLKGKGLTKRN